MDDVIKFKSSNKSFFKYLNTNGKVEKGTYYIKNEELKEFFDFQNSEESIKVSVSPFKDFIKCIILGKSFLLYNNEKEIKDIDSNGVEKNIVFQSLNEETNYLKKLLENPNSFDFYLKTPNNKWKIMLDKQNIKITDLKNQTYKVVKKNNIKIDNINFTPFYNDYINIPNLAAYKDFSFKEAPIRKKLFDDLDTFFTIYFDKFLAICGHSGSGKTTSILYYINENRNNHNMFYINCYTILRNELNNEAITKILYYELEKAIPNNEDNDAINIKNILEEFKKYLDSLINSNTKRDNTFIFKIIRKIIDIYNKEKSSKPLNIIIDQYSSKYDKDNENIFQIIDTQEDKNNKCQILLVSSMNNTYVSNNLKKSLKNINIYYYQRYIKYTLYGQLFEINDVIDGENNDFKNIMRLNFDNSALMYYKLKSKILNEKDVNENNIISQFIIDGKADIKNEILLFYNIISSNLPLEKKTNNVILNIIRTLEHIKHKPFINYENIPNLIEKLPFKYFKILYHELDESHPELIKLLPNEVKEKINAVSINPDSQRENINLKNNIKNTFEDLNNYLCKFTGNNKSIVSFFTVEPLYPIIEECLKEIIAYYVVEDYILNSIYFTLKGGIRGDIFEYIFLNHIKKHKNIFKIYFESIENINSLVPHNFSISKFSYRLFILKKNMEEKLIQQPDNNKQKENNEENDDIATNSQTNINYKKKNYTISRDPTVFIELQKIIKKTFNKCDIIYEKKLPKKNIYLNQLNSNGKYVDGGLLIYLNEDNDKLNFKLIAIQISIKRKKIKIFNQNESSLILSYIKEHLEKYFININITESSFYYIMDLDKPDNNIKEECFKYSIGCYGYSIKQSLLQKINYFNFSINKFSKFNSCFLLKNDNEGIGKSINEEEPTIFKKIEKDKLEKYFEPILDKDIQIADNYYIYNKIRCDLQILNNLTNFTLLISLDGKEDIQYIILDENKILDYSLNKVNKINEIIINNNNLRLIVFLIPMKLKRKFK